MFLIAPSEAKCRVVLERLRGALETVAPGPIAVFDLGGSVLGWFRARRSDNLHVYQDGYVIGKLMPGEASRDAPVPHDGALPAEAHPLARSVSVGVSRGLRVRPHNAAGVFYDGDAVSDTQLLLADLNGRSPSEEGVALLATVGYLPGELTLFQEVRRIPFLHAYSLPAGSLERVESFPSREPDDRYLVERLSSIVPRGPRAFLAISGGCDSRFVLGILIRAGLSPELLRLSDPEDPIAVRLSEETRLPLRIPERDATLPLALYTAMTDGQIYSGGGHYSWLRGAFTRDAVCYFGLFADSILKNAFRAAWKNPLPGGSLVDRLIVESLLSRMRTREPGFNRPVERRRLLELLRSELRSSWDHGNFRGPKQRANWFYYLHRGLRWTAAHTADADFFVEVVNPLSDLQATASGLRSSAWSNFHNGRVRMLNAALLPEVNVGYASGQAARVRTGLRGAAEKLAYEFGSRLVSYVGQRRVGVRTGAAPAQGGSSVRPSEAQEFRRYFDRSLEAIWRDSECSSSVRRAAATVNEVLHYLAAPKPGAHVPVLPNSAADGAR